MRKVILLFFVFCFKIVGQTYTLDVLNTMNSSFCNGVSTLETTWSIGPYSSGNGPIGSPDFTKTFTILATKPFRTSPYGIYINNVCINYVKGMNGVPYNCPESISQQKTELEMVTSPILNFEFTTCNFYMAFNLKPNVTISNMKAETLCAGETLELAAFPSGFPDEVYHWQYSLNNVIWSDIPSKTVSGFITNNTKNLKIRIDEILGSAHIAFFKDLYFRLGYGERAFTSPIKINYQSCAPVITDVQYEAPKCNGGGVQKLEVIFDRTLDAAKNENLSQLYIKETTNNTGIIKTTPMFQVSNVVYPDNTKIYSYSNISSFTSLENGREYEVVYQAQIDNPSDTSKKILKGTMVSAKKIRYIDPKPLTFKINANNPKCNNGKVDITIEADGGTLPYYYDDLNGETEIINGLPQIKRILFDPSDPNKKTVTIQQVEPKAYIIKVTDTNYCIEK